MSPSTFKRYVAYYPIWDTFEDEGLDFLEIIDKLNTLTKECNQLKEENKILKKQLMSLLEE